MLRTCARFFFVSDCSIHQQQWQWHLSHPARTPVLPLMHRKGRSPASGVDYESVLGQFFGSAPRVLWTPEFAALKLIAWSPSGRCRLPHGITTHLVVVPVERRHTSDERERWDDELNAVRRKLEQEGAVHVRKGRVVDQRRTATDDPHAHFWEDVWRLSAST